MEGELKGGERFKADKRKDDGVPGKEIGGQKVIGVNI